ncbi:hypothetical protein ABFS83_08G225100 [Erythranthe nasuta]
MACSELNCRKHPNQNPQPGICPSCLRDKLSGILISGNNNYNYYYSSTSPPVYYYYSSSGSASSSGGSSPANRRRGRGRGRGHQRFASDIMDSIYLAVSGSSSTAAGLKKSRSIAFASRNINGGGGESVDPKKKKKGGFWNKLLLRSSVNKAYKL